MQYHLKFPDLILKINYLSKKRDNSSNIYLGTQRINNADSNKLPVSSMKKSLQTYKKLYLE